MTAQQSTSQERTYLVRQGWLSSLTGFLKGTPEESSQVAKSILGESCDRKETWRS